MNKQEEQRFIELFPNDRKNSILKALELLKQKRDRFYSAGEITSQAKEIFHNQNPNMMGYEILFREPDVDSFLESLDDNAKYFYVDLEMISVKRADASTKCEQVNNYYRMN